MEFFDFINLLKRKKGTILSLVFLVIVISAGISLLNPLKYSAESRLLVIQNTSGVDPYTVSKSNEYLGNLFSQVAYSGSFYNLVIESPYDIDKSYFSGNYNNQMKIWDKTIQTKTLADTGIIEINVYHPNPYQAQQIALAVNDILINKNSNYQGNGQAIKVNIIDQPLISNYPVKPNLPQNILIALMASLLFSLFYIYIFPEESYNIRLLPRRKTKRAKINNQAININYQDFNRTIAPELNQEPARQSQNYNQNYQSAVKPNYNHNQNYQNNPNNQNLSQNQRQDKPSEFRAQGDINNILK
jgi:capsular polysaccharide biosynthesis protein